MSDISQETERSFDEETASDSSHVDLDDGFDANARDQLHLDPNPSNTAARSFSAPCHVLLPVEVWERIMLNTDIKDIPSIMRVSKQHYAMSQMVSFRARYLLQHNMRCEAIFQASLHPLLFTPQLLEALMKMGAVMTRHFVLRFHQLYNGMGQHCGYYRTPLWTKQITFHTYTAVLNAAHQLYGETIVLRARKDEASVISEWITSKDRSDTINDTIEEVFVCGRYAPFDKRDERSHDTIGAVIAKHPSLIDILECNGYDFKKADPGSIVANLFADSKREEGELYERITELLLRYPDWEASAACCKDLLELDSDEIRWGITIPDGQDEMQKMLENDGLGPVPAAFKVLKRLYYEGKAFKDLYQYLESCLTKKDYCREAFPPYKTAGYRILYRYFPDLLGEIREDLAKAFIKAWHRKLPKNVVDDPRSEMLHQGLIKQLKEFQLSPCQVARLCSEPDFSPRIILPALVAGLFGSDWIDRLDTIFQTLISRLLENPLAGKQLKELAEEANRGTKRGFIEEDFFANQLHAVVNSWVLDLDLLSADQSGSESIKFRSPLGWMVLGSSGVKSRHCYESHLGLRPLDPYSLFVASSIPDGQDPLRDDQSVYMSSKNELTFGILQDTSKISLLLEEALTQITIESKRLDRAKKTVLRKTRVEAYWSYGRVHWYCRCCRHPVSTGGRSTARSSGRGAQHERYSHDRASTRG